MPVTAATHRAVSVATPDMCPSRFSAVRSAVRIAGNGPRMTSSGRRQRRTSIPVARRGARLVTSRPAAPTNWNTASATTRPATTPGRRATSSAVPCSAAGIVAAVVTSGPSARSSASPARMTRSTTAGSSPDDSSFAAERRRNLTHLRAPDQRGIRTWPRSHVMSFGAPSWAPLRVRGPARPAWSGLRPRRHVTDQMWPDPVVATHRDSPRASGSRGSPFAGRGRTRAEASVCRLVASQAARLGRADCWSPILRSASAAAARPGPDRSTPARSVIRCWIWSIAPGSSRPRDAVVASGLPCAAGDPTRGPRRCARRRPGLRAGSSRRAGSRRGRRCKRPRRRRTGQGCWCGRAGRS